MTLHKVQVYLDREGASDLVAELVMKSCLSPSVFTEAVQLGIAFLEGGNPVIQRSLYNKLQSAETSAIFHDKMRESQNEIRSIHNVRQHGHRNVQQKIERRNDGRSRRRLQLLCENRNRDLQEPGPGA